MTDGSVGCEVVGERAVGFYCRRPPPAPLAASSQLPKDCRQQNVNGGDDCFAFWGYYYDDGSDDADM